MSSPSLRVRNPHSVLAALETRPSDVIQVTLPANIERSGDEAWKKVFALAKRHRIRVVEPSREPRGQRGGPKTRDSRDEEEGGRHSLMEALIEPKPSVSAEELFLDARERGGGKGIWLALDSLQDPQNVGAIFRLAGFFGIEGVLLTSERSAPLTGTVYDVSCGGVEYVPYTMQVNLQRAFEVAKEAGLWILGTSEHARSSYLTLERDRPWLIVVGNEEKGMRRLTEEACDITVQIPPLGGVTSLNVSTATGILISRLSAL